MGIRHKRIWLGKILLLVMLLVGGLTSLGCIRGLQPIGWSGGAIVDGTLFVGSIEGRLVAVNLADSSRQWSQPLKASRSAGGFGCAAPTAGGGCAASPAGVAIYGTPVVAGDLVYIGGYNGKVYAFNSSSLETRWVYPREGYLPPIIGGLVVAQGKVYFGSSDGKVYALDADTGDWKWDFPTGDKIWSTPAIDGDTLYIGSFDKKLYALNVTDGSPRWQPFETEGAIASTPLVYNNTIYFGSFDRHLYAVNTTDGSLKWKSEVEAGSWFWARPVVYNNTVYAPSLDGKVYALDAESGNVVVDAIDLQSPISSSPIVVNSSIIFASQQGVIYALDTGSKQLKRLADIEEEVYSPLSSSEGVIYIHTQDQTLHRVNADTGAILMSISLKSKG